MRNIQSELLDHIENPIVVIDKSGRLVFANTAAKSVLNLPRIISGYSAGMILKENPWITAGILSGEVIEDNSVTIDTSGTIWHIERKSLNHPGELNGAVLFTLHDLNPLKDPLSDYAIKHIINHSCIFFENRLGYFSWLASGKTIWGGATVQITGYTNEDLLKMNMKGWNDLIHPDDRADASGRLEAAVSTYSEYYNEYRIRKKDGTYTHVSDSGVFMPGPSDKPEKILGTVKDISKRINMEEELRLARSKAEEANVAKTQFLSVMSHEMRTPLHGIRAAAELLRESSLNDKQEQYLSMLESSSDKLQSLLDEALDVTLIESGRINLQKDTLTIDAVLDELWELFSSKFHEKGIALIINRLEGTGDVLSCDRRRLSQILSNLVDNAIKYTDKGSVEVTGSAKDNFMQFMVKDTGIGIAPDKLDKIFKPFSRLSDKNTGLDGGIGLGLSIAKELCVAMGGSVCVTSEPGNGSVFTIRIPYEKPSGKFESEISRNTIKPLPPLNVLAVDDIPENLRVLRHYFEGTSVALITAESGEEALKVLDEWKLDCVLLDMQLPGMHGEEVVRAIRKKEIETGAERMPVFAVTAAAYPNDRKRALAAGCDKYLVRPFSRSDLFKALLEISSVGASGAGSIEFILPQATERIQKLVSEMSDALDKADFIKVKKLGHDIRGLAATFGLDDIERGSESIERFASDHDELRIRQLLERLLSE